MIAAASQHESGSTVAFVLIIVLVIGVIAWLALEAAVKAIRYVHAKTSSDKKGEKS